MTETAALLSPATNYAIVQLPGRRFPGIVFQGDSAHNIFVQLNGIRTLAKKCGEKQLDAEIDDICELFSTIIKGYEAVCESHGIELPYPR
jgi:hypothetical protein